MGGVFRPTPAWRPGSRSPGRLEVLLYGPGVLDHFRALDHLQVLQFTPCPGGWPWATRSSRGGSGQLPMALDLCGALNDAPRSPPAPAGAGLQTGGLQLVGVQ